MNKIKLKIKKIKTPIGTVFIAAYLNAETILVVTV